MTTRSRKAPAFAVVRQLAACVLFLSLSVGAAVLYYRGHNGSSWDDAGDGECFTRTPMSAAQEFQTSTYPRTPVIACDDPNANYVIAVHTTGTALQCPDGGKDFFTTGRVKSVSDNGRRARTRYVWGLMCAAPVLHVGRCYDTTSERGISVRPQECGLWSWQVTRRVDGVSDIRQCSPATGLVLTQPKVTYCEIVAPPPSDLQRLAQGIHVTPPPAG